MIGERGRKGERWKKCKKRREGEREIMRAREREWLIWNEHQLMQRLMSKKAATRV